MRLVGPSSSVLIAMTVATVVSLRPAVAADEDPPHALSAEVLATADVVDALDDIGARVLDTAPTSIEGDAVVSGTGVAAVAVPLDPSEPVTLGGAGPDDDLRIGVPRGTDAHAEVVGGVSIFTDAKGTTATAVNPLEDGGAQFLVTIGSAESPTRFAFPVTVPDGALFALTDDGGAEITLADGTIAASIPAPWAVDADGARVQTHFEVAGDALVQVVDHRNPGIAYPVVADPSVFSCDWWTSTCVKFTKSETKSIASWATPGSTGAGIWVSNFCAKIPNGAVALGCKIVVGIVAAALSKSFNSAAGAGRCVEIHFSRLALLQTHWKTEKC
jgi:hypothetical protein